MERKSKELEQATSVVDEWVKKLSETFMAGELDRSALRQVLESLGANPEISEDERRKFHGDSYSNAQRSPAMKAVWENRYGEFVEFTKSFSVSEVKFKKTGNKDKIAGMKQLLGELTAYAFTTEEEFSQGDFMARITARAINGKFRQVEITHRTSRMFIKVSGYNMVNYVFYGQEGDKRTGEMPFAPASFPPEFPQQAWNFMKSWKK